MARRSKKIDFTHWGSIQRAFLAQGAGSVAATVVSALAATTETILRTRGHLVCSLDGVQGSGILIDVAVGFLVVPGGTGTTVTSTPITDPGAPWFWYERFTIGNEEVVTDIYAMPGLQVFRSVIDAKSMRILRSDREVQMVMEQATISGGSSVNLAVSGRILIGT